VSISELISGVLQPMFDLLPRIEQRPAQHEWLIVEPWLGNVRSTRRPVVFIPAFTHVERYPHGEYPLDTGFQSVVTADEKHVTANATAIISVDDPILLRQVTTFENWEEWASMIVRGAVKCVLSEHNMSHLSSDAEGMIYLECSDRLSHAGIHVEQLVLEDFTITRQFRLFGGYNE
jgi:uncharacterized membrane protein YqiK